MTALSDTLTVSLVLVLLFGSIALYLYTRIQQAEQRINLLDSIVLELKMSSEVKSYTELPAGDYDTDFHSTNQSSHTIPISSDSAPVVAEYKPFDESEEVDDDSVSQASSVSSKHSVQKGQQELPSAAIPVVPVTEVDDVEFYKSVLDSQSESNSKATKVNVNYESMNIKELHVLAKQRGITGATVMKKQTIIDSLKSLDRGSSNTTIEPGSVGTSSLGSFLETSAFLGQQNETAAKTLTIDDE